MRSKPCCASCSLIGTVTAIPLASASSSRPSSGSTSPTTSSPSSSSEKRSASGSSGSGSMLSLRSGGTGAPATACATRPPRRRRRGSARGSTPERAARVHAPSFRRPTSGATGSGRRRRPQVADGLLDLPQQRGELLPRRTRVGVQVVTPLRLALQALQALQRGPDGRVPLPSAVDRPLRHDRVVGDGSTQRAGRAQQRRETLRGLRAGDLLDAALERPQRLEHAPRRPRCPPRAAAAGGSVGARATPRGATPVRRRAPARRRGAPPRPRRPARSAARRRRPRRARSAVRASSWVSTAMSSG